MTATESWALATVVAGDEMFATEHGSFDVLLSTPALDRDGERLLTAEWLLPLPAHITFDIDHGMSVATTIGSGVPFINRDGNLQVLGTFASTPLAQTTRALVNEGHIRTTSVAFRRLKAADGSTVRELLNGAFVAIPANPEALVLTSKQHRHPLDADEALANVYRVGTRFLRNQLRQL